MTVRYQTTVGRQVRVLLKALKRSSEPQDHCHRTLQVAIVILIHRQTWHSLRLQVLAPPAPCVPLLIPFYQHHVRSGGLLQPGCASLIHSLCFQVIRHLLLLFKEGIAPEGRGN